MTQRMHGFTLIEALIVLAIGAILLGAAVPALTGALESARASSAKADLLQTLTRSIGHAAMAGSEVVLCPGDAHGCRDTADWSHGWIAYADIDGNRRRSANETLLQLEPALAGKVHLRTTPGRTRLVFQPNGGNAGSNASFTLCDGRGAAQAMALVLANDGRLRAGKAAAASARSCVQPM
jgi:type IV fimbrial biogenesis protein FimT